LSSEEESDTEKSRKRRKKKKKTQKKPEDKSKSEHEPDEEAQKQREVVRQESRGLEENDIIEMMGRHVAPHLTQFQHGLHTHINQVNNRLEEQICLLCNQQSQMQEQVSQMQEQVNFLLAQQNQHQLEQFSCASLGGSFTLDVGKKQDDHVNSEDDSSKVDNATKETLQISGGPQIFSDSNATQSKPPAKSQSTPKISKDQDKTSRKPRKGKSHDEEKTKVSYYLKFQERIRGEPAAVDVGANAGLVNSNVSCYSNAILQCLASCIHFSDFSPSVNHPEFPLNHAFASLMISMMVGGEQIINPSSFTDVFMPLFRPQVGEVNADEQEGMYYDFA
jgi:hypothetical protein